MTINIRVPLRDKDIILLKAGDRVQLSGTVYTARDQAHKRLVGALHSSTGKLPFILKNQVIYYAGPTDTRPGAVIGSCGPTTSSRMDIYTPYLLEHGLRGMIGKGERSEEVIKSIIKYKAVYFIAVGGCGALYSSFIKKTDVIAYPDLGCEAIRMLEIDNFPVIVGIDSKGKNILRRE